MTCEELVTRKNVEEFDPKHINNHVQFNNSIGLAVSIGGMLTAFC